MIWALSDKSGQAAHKFLSLAPPIEWLGLLEKSGLMKLPSPVDTGQDWSGFRLQPVHPISGTLHEWLLGHLDKQELIERAIERNTILELSFRWELHRKLYYLKQPIPKPYRRFWELLASPSVMSAAFDFSTKTYELINRLNAGETDPLLILEATDQLRPIAALSKPILRMLLQEQSNSVPLEVGDLVDFDLRLVASDHTHDLITSLKTLLTQNPPLLAPGRTRHQRRDCWGIGAVDYEPDGAQVGADGPKVYSGWESVQGE